MTRGAEPGPLGALDDVVASAAPRGLLKFASVGRLHLDPLVALESEYVAHELPVVALVILRERG
jgi:hypothetical protein